MRFTGRLHLLGSRATVNAASPTAQPLEPLASRPPHFAAKARQVVHLFMNGDPSHIDTFDPKPVMTKYHAEALPRLNLRTERKTGAALGSPFAFKKYRPSGIEVSELFARTAEQHIDDLCIVRSLYADVPNHEPSLMLMNCGDGRLKRPNMGAWITYGSDGRAVSGRDYHLLRHRARIPRRATLIAR